MGNPEVKTTLEMKEKVVKYSVTNKETKREAKMELATQLVQVFDGLGGLDSVTCPGTSSLPARTAHKEGGKLWWELAKESRKKANRKTVNAVYNARDKLLAKNFKRFSQVLVRCASESCGVLSWRENEKCSKCHEPLEKGAVSKKKKVVAYTDVERTDGDVRSTPISIGVVVSLPNGKLIEKEIFVIPDENSPWPAPSWYCTKKIHRMYIKGRKLMKLGDSAQKPVILPTVSEKEAAQQFVDILKEHQVDILVFHGEDQRTIRPLRLTITMHDSRKFFELIQEGKAVLGEELC